MKSLRFLQRQALQQFTGMRRLQWQTDQLQTQIQSLRQLSSRSGSATVLRSQQLHKPHITSRTFSSHVRPVARKAFRAGPQRRAYSSTSSSSTNNGTTEVKLSLSQRLRKLSREYGWSAVGVYLALSALDFPFCFLAVRLLGTDRIGHWEHVIISKVKDMVAVIWPASRETIDGLQQEGTRILEEGIGRVEKVTGTEPEPGTRLLELEGRSDGADDEGVIDHGYKQAEKANTGANASIWTQLALAYAIHKSFIFIRVPLTAAVTPKVVKTLRSWGWNIGKRPAKKSITTSSPTSTGSSATNGGSGASGTGVNTKRSGVKDD